MLFYLCIINNVDICNHNSKLSTLNYKLIITLNSQLIIILN
jgi:hypothetical protein